MDLLIRNARVVDWSQDFMGDIYIKDGKITKIGRNLEGDCKVMEGEGLVVLPSFIDLHAHFRDPGLMHKEDILSGSLAAVRGGYTAVNLMANTKPVCSTMDTVNYVLNKAEKTGLVDIHQCISITRDFDGRDTGHLDNMENSVRIISDDGKGVTGDRAMYDAMARAARKGIVVMSHAEVEDITPIDTRLSENLMTFRDLSLAAVTRCNLHMAHVSTREAMEAVIRAKRDGVSVTCEVTPHHIALTEETDYRVNPPLRKKEDVDFLIEAIKDGWVDTISTDHAPHTSEDKEKGAPGISGIETAFTVCFTKLVREGHITLSKLSEIMSRNPARIMGLNKGEIKIGFDGDLVLVDIDRKCRILAGKFASKGRNTPFDGMEAAGAVVKTIKGGRIVFREGESA